MLISEFHCHGSKILRVFMFLLSILLTQKTGFVAMVLLNNTRELAMALRVEGLQRIKNDLTPTQVMFSLKQVEGSI